MSADIIDHVYTLGNRFRGRMEDWRLDFALGYIKHNELPLAFETLCDYLYEQEVTITPDEFAALMKIESYPGMTLNAVTKSSLADLVRPDFS